ncbi:MAG: hypothetical protein ACFHX7_23145 [Pseudomonadota bacterium]
MKKIVVLLLLAGWIVPAFGSMIVNVDATQHYVFNPLYVTGLNPGDTLYFEPISEAEGGDYTAYQLGPGGLWYSYFYVKGGISPTGGEYGDYGGYNSAAEAFAATRALWDADLADNGVIDLFRMTISSSLAWTYPAGDKFVNDNSGGFSFRLHINELDPVAAPAPLSILLLLSALAGFVLVTPARKLRGLPA